MAYDALTTPNSLTAWLKTSNNAASQLLNDNAEIGVLINVASELIGRYLNRDNLGGVYPYVENYFRSSSLMIPSRPWMDLVLRHWPIVSLTSVVASNSPITILTAAQLQAAQAGVYVMEDLEPRVLKFQYLRVAHPITVTYTAGYANNAVPLGLQQACNQYASEIFRSPNWIGMKSQGIQGETTSYDTGDAAFGMSTRVKAMLNPYKNIIPFMGY